MINLLVVSQETRTFEYKGKQANMLVFTVNPRIASEEVPVGTYEAVGVRSMVGLFRLKNEDLGKESLQAKSKMMHYLGNIAEVGDREMKLFELSSVLKVFKQYNPQGSGVRSDVLRRYMIYMNPDSELGKAIMALMQQMEKQVPGTDWDEERPNTQHWLDYTEDQRLKAKAQKVKKSLENNAGTTGAGVLTLNIEEKKEGGISTTLADELESQKKQKTEMVAAATALDGDDED